MAEGTVHASREIFKDISIEAQRLRFIAQSQQVFIDRARVRGARIGDSELLFILDEVESFHSSIRECSDRLEKIAARLSYLTA